MIERLLRKYTLKWSPAMFKATVVGVILAAFFIPVAIVGIPWIEFLNDMAAQPKAKSQMTYGRTFGHTIPTERPPVPGTVPREDMVAYPFVQFGEGIVADKQGGSTFKQEIEAAKQVGLRFNNPLDPTMAEMKLGQGSFNIYCKTCHGSKANGDGPVVGPNRFPAPPSLHTDEVRGYRDGTIFHIMTKGVGKMESYADKLTPTERWRTILYIRALQRAMHPTQKDLDQ